MVVTDDELTKLRYFYESFLGQQQVLRDLSAKQPWMTTGQFRLFWDEVSRIKSGFPHLLPAASVQDFATEGMPDTYEVSPIQSYIAMALARIKSSLDDAQENTPKHAAGPSSTNIFVVHGHDEEMKQAVARTLSKLGLNPIILHEQPNMGKTIIEKFEKNADVQFAIVLLSPDDMAYSVNSTAQDAQPRARQNVILELGYFVGKLSREKVFTLKQ